MHFFSKIRKVFLTTLAVSLLTLPVAAEAAKKKQAAKTQQAQSEAEDAKYAALVIDADTGTVIHQENAGKIRYPASLTKIMTLYLTFQAIDRGKLTMNTMLRATAHSAGQKPSVIGLRPGQAISVRDAVNAVIIKSANDAAAVLAEAVSGTEAKFALQMTRTAKSLGMNHTVFANASGLPDSRQVTTAYDLARLAIALRRDYPHYYPLFSKESFTYNGNTIYSHNRVTRNYRGADGLKTGYIRASGFNLVTSARRGETSLVGVVMGGRSIKSRDTNMVKLLDQAFSKMSKSAANDTKNKDSAPANNDTQDYSEDDSQEDADSAAVTKAPPPAQEEVAINKKAPKSSVKAPSSTPASSETSGAEKFSRNVIISDEALKLAKPEQAPATTAQQDVPVPVLAKRDIFSPGTNIALNAKQNLSYGGVKPIRVRVNGKRVPIPLMRSDAQESGLVKSTISPRGDKTDEMLKFASAQ